MARSAQSLLTVHHHHLSHRHLLLRPLLRLLQSRHIRRCRRRRCVEQILQHKQPPLHRTCPRRIRSHHQQAPMRQYSSPVTLLRQRHLPHLISFHSFNPVILSQRLIQKRVVRCEHLQRTPVLFDQVRKKQLRLQLHRTALLPAKDLERIPKVLDPQHPPRIHIDPFHISRLQPLPHKVLHKPPRLRIIQHPIHLIRQIRPQFATLSQLKQLRIRQRTPQKIRQPRRQRKLIHRHHLRRIVRLRLHLRAKQKPR